MTARGANCLQRSRRTLKPAPDPEPKDPAATNATDARKGALRAIGGSDGDGWNEVLASQVLAALWVKFSDPETRKKQIDATFTALIGIAPQDEIEGMLAAQLIAAHNATLECYRRAMVPDQTIEGWREALTQANKLSRTWTTLIEALNRYRGKGQQKVTVEHVHVHAGGQAVVGTVTTAGRKRRESDRRAQGHERLAHAPEQALRSPSPDSGRHAVPVTGNEERALPDARRSLDRSAEAQQKRAQARPLHR